MPVVRPVRVLALAAALSSGAGGIATAVPAASRPGAGRAAVNASWPLALLHHDKEAFSSPRRDSRLVAVVRETRPITGGQTVLPVIAHARGRGDTEWLRVLLPGRPNGRTGWISAPSTTPTVTRWQIDVRLASRSVAVLHDGRVKRRFRAVVGAPSTPTPGGRFFIEETVRLGRQEPGAPYALALSARSSVLQEFAGGPGQIAVHGTNNLVGVPGTAASHGCIRLSTKAITWLARRVGPGTRVTITR